MMASAPLPLAAPSLANSGRGILRLFRIEIRRSLGLLLFPMLVGIMWLASHQLSYGMEMPGVALWPEDSLAISSASLLLTPFVAALTAWAAAAEQRRRLGELLMTTPRPPAARDLSRWAGTVSWALLAYAAVAVVTLIQTAQSATWGGPNVRAILMGAAFIPAAGATGFLVGSMLPSRFVPPLVAIGFYLLEVSIGAQGPSDPLPAIKYLSPAGLFTSGDPSRIGVFYESALDLYGQATLWLIMSTAALLSMLAVYRNRTPAAVGALAVAVAVAAVSAAPLLATPADQGSMPSAAITYDPVCADEAVPVCVHPAYERLLPNASRIIGTLVVPLTGFDGGIVQADQSPDGSEVTATGVFHWSFVYATELDAFMPDWIAETLVHDFSADSADCAGRMNNAQYAVSLALEARGGWALQPGDRQEIRTCEMAMMGTGRAGQPVPNTAPVQADVRAAANRFAALAPAEQRAWFAENYPALRAGELTLDDLP